jgi:uncharacterized glyoxalase superfamily protein PhnB
MLLLIGGMFAFAGQANKQPVAINTLTPNLYAERIEPCVQFWVERLGFEKIMEVPDGDRLAFALLKKGDLEIMYGSYASLEKDLNVLGGRTAGPAFLYLRVQNLDRLLNAMAGAEVVKSVHTTFYGAREFSVKDPAGHIITFAQFGSEKQGN